MTEFDLQVKIKELEAENTALSKRNMELEPEIVDLNIQLDPGEWIFVITKYENFVFDNEQDFLEEFLTKRKFPLGDVELIGIWFSSTTVKFNYLVGSGQHITDSITHAEFFKWYNQLVKKKQNGS